MTLTRREAVLSLAAIGMAGPAFAQTDKIWSVTQTHDALLADRIRLIDIRSRKEWQETGLAQGAWPISLHEARFPQRLFAAQQMADGRTIALICATGGRTGSVMRALTQNKHGGFVDVSEGMMGSRLGKGWIASGLPIATLEDALQELPQTLG